MPRTMTLDNESYVLLPHHEYQELMARAHGIEMPAYPKPGRKGQRDAVQFGLVSISREIVTRRLAADLTQEQLAVLAGVRVETISRLESAKHHPQQATLARVDKALREAGA